MELDWTKTMFERIYIWQFFFVFSCLTRTPNKPNNINVMICWIKSLLFRVNYWYFICHLNSLIKYCDWPKAKQNGSIQDQLNQIEIPTWFREWNTTACLNAWRFFIWIFVWFWCGSSNEHRVLNIESIFCTIVVCCTFYFFHFNVLYTQSTCNHMLMECHILDVL